MRNKIVFQIVCALFFLAGSSRSELAEATWLLNYLSSRRANFDTLQRDAYRLAGDLDGEKVEKLRGLLSKVATNSSEVTENECLAANAALWLLSAAKAPGLVETSIPLLQVSRISVDATAAEVMGRTGSEAVVEPIEAAFQRNLKAYFDKNAPDKTGHFMHALALNGTPKARAAFERARVQLLDAYKTRNVVLSEVDRDAIANHWSEVQEQLAIEGAERGLPNPENAKRIWPPKKEAGPKGTTPNVAPNGSPATPISLPIGTTQPVERRLLPGGWPPWAAVAAVVLGIAGWLGARATKSKR